MRTRVAIVTDAWLPQVNGVVTTLGHTRRELETAGHRVRVCSPDEHRTVACPTYPEIRLALWPYRRLAWELDRFEPDAIHIATEGPLGMAARRYCARNRLAFTTSYHTRFPQYVAQRLPIPERASYAFLRQHHNAARRTLVATPGQRKDLLEHGFANVVLWPRGVDIDLFKPCGRDYLPYPRPIFVYAGRVAVEKNLTAFLDLDLPGTKVIVGDGPSASALSARYSAAKFLGYRFGVELARALSSADVFVFPSRTDTFGLVMLEAMACGTPVAAFPVTGPVDVVADGRNGVLADNLGAAALAALDIDRVTCRADAVECTWAAATRRFRSHLVEARSGRDLGV